jgi:hypothetical protein
MISFIDECDFDLLRIRQRASTIHFLGRTYALKTMKNENESNDKYRK